MQRIVGLGLTTGACLIAALAAAIGWGGPSTPPRMDSISQPFRWVDWSGMPSPRRYAARDGAQLAYRAYLPPAGRAGRAGQGSVVLVHGSSANGRSMHVMAKALAASGYAAYALDIRGHGDSGVRGRIDYVGQLEDDLQDFLAAIQPAQPATLAGFSAGGGFALRFAASERQALFSNYLLLSPFLGQDAPNYRPDSGGWVRIGLPRILGLMALNTVGIHAFDDLVVTRFALSDADVEAARLTPAYSFALARNFRPEAHYRSSIRAVRQPVRVLAGEADEAFHAQRLAGIFLAEGQPWPVTLVPGIGHIGLTLDSAAIAATLDALNALARH